MGRVRRSGKRRQDRSRAGRHAVVDGRRGSSLPGDAGDVSDAGDACQVVVKGRWMIDAGHHYEEWINGLIHAAAAALALGGTCWMVSLLGQQIGTWRGMACLVFCAALVAVFVASTLSHWVGEPAWRHRLRCWDQGLIFILIVASFWPISIAYLSGFWIGFTAALWLLALWGFLAKVAFSHRVDRVLVRLYLILGWLPIASFPTIRNAAPELVGWIVAGGVIYSLGAVFLLNSRRIPFAHAGWHVAVAVASTIHFLAIVNYVVLPGK